MCTTVVHVDTELFEVSYIYLQTQFKRFYKAGHNILELCSVLAQI